MSSDRANSHPNRHVLESFLAGRLTDSKIEAVGEHLAGCEKCTRELEDLPTEPVKAVIHARFSDRAPCSRQVREDTIANVVGRIRETIAGFHSVELHRSGGMGIIVRAERLSDDPSDDSGTVAIKIFDEEYSALFVDAAFLASLRQRFRREFEILKSLEHRCIPKAYRYCHLEQSGTELFELEWIPGRSLNEHLKARAATEMEARNLLKTLMMALDHVHGRGVIHRDVSPANCMVADHSFSLIDFGLARRTDEDDTCLTMVNTFLGTHRFASPQQKREPSKADMRDDIFSAGMTIGWALSSPEARKLYEGITEYTYRSIDPKFRCILLKMVAVSRDERFQTARAVLAALSELPSVAPARNRPIRRHIAAAVVLLCVGFVGILGRTRPAALDEHAGESPLQTKTVAARNRIHTEYLGETKSAPVVILADLQTSDPDAEFTLRVCPDPSTGAPATLLRLCAGIDHENEIARQLADESAEKKIVRRPSIPWKSSPQQIRIRLNGDRATVLLGERRIMVADHLKLSPGKVWADFVRGEFTVRRLSVVADSG